MSDKRIVGSIESISLPELELYDIDVKVDTGAENCAMHADIISVTVTTVTFQFLDGVHPSYNGKIFTLPISRIGHVRSSNGRKKKRYFIKTVLEIFGKNYKTEISIADRSKMKYPMLLGKQFLKNKFLVDVSKNHLSKKVQ